MSDGGYLFCIDESLTSYLVFLASDSFPQGFSTDSLLPHLVLVVEISFCFITRTGARKRYPGGQCKHLCERNKHLALRSHRSAD